MDLTRNIYSAELNLRQPAEDFFIRIWGNTRLPSHDIDHHRRVWHYAKELLQKTAEYRGGKFSFSPDQLLLACYFHDIGMSIDTGQRHGKISRNLCERFLTENLMDNSCFQETLIAIEEHDIKEPVNLKTDLSITSILSAADDIDALGFTGIFRYTEIYLKRGINMDELSYRIQENADIRFKNLVTNFGDISDFIDKQRKRYNILINFFSEYNDEITGKIAADACISLIKYFKKMIEDEESPPGYLYEAFANSDYAVHRWFLDGFMAESVIQDQSQATF